MPFKATGFIRRESFFKRMILRGSFWCIILLGLFIFPIVRSVYRELPPELPRLLKLPSFQLSDEFSKDFGSKELQGKAYIASFLFTSCATSCLKIVEKMKIIQKRIRGVGKKIHLVTFSVDPEHDTPEILFKYARRQHANPYIWKFLTGKRGDVSKILVDGFKVPMGDRERTTRSLPDEEVELFDIAHSEKVVLVDRVGIIRGYYSLNEQDTNKLMIDVGLLINRSEWRKHHE